MQIKDKILSASTRKSEPVPVPEWDTTVVVQSMNGAERDAYEHTLYQQREEGTDPTANMRARLLVHCLYDEAGSRIFEPTDAESLGQQDGAIVKRLFEVAARLNGLNAEAAAGAAKK